MRGCLIDTLLILQACKLSPVRGEIHLGAAPVDVRQSPALQSLLAVPNPLFDVSNLVVVGGITSERLHCLPGAGHLRLKPFPRALQNANFLGRFRA
ncbi:hypothetical protein D3C72_2170610 [compost metagenome]